MTACQPPPEPVDVTNDWNPENPPSIAIVEAIAAIDGLDPTNLDFSLYDFVDPDALDRLFRTHAGGDLQVELRVRDLLVTVRADGCIGVRMPDRREKAQSETELETVSQLP